MILLTNYNDSGEVSSYLAVDVPTAEELYDILENIPDTVPSKLPMADYLTGLGYKVVPLVGHIEFDGEPSIDMPTLDEEEPDTEDCIYCGGAGGLKGLECDMCNGEGRVEVREGE